MKKIFAIDVGNMSLEEVEYIIDRHNKQQWLIDDAIMIHHLISPPRITKWQRFKKKMWDIFDTLGYAGEGL